MGESQLIWQGQINYTSRKTKRRNGSTHQREESLWRRKTHCWSCWRSCWRRTDSVKDDWLCRQDHVCSHHSTSSRQTQMLKYYKSTRTMADATKSVLLDGSDGSELVTYAVIGPWHQLRSTAHLLSPASAHTTLCWDCLTSTLAHSDEPSCESAAHATRLHQLRSIPRALAQGAPQ